MNKILITGANGFVGAKVCSTLCTRGLNFVSVVRQNADSDQFAIGEITGVTEWNDILFGCDVVIHLAARVHIMNDKSLNPLAEFRATNVDATLNLARQAAKRGVKRFVFISSVKVNGELTEEKPFSAFDDPAPSDPYGISKMEAEQGLLAIGRDTGLEIVIIRPPLVYGPGVRANFRQLMWFVKLGVPLPFGSIRNRRSMVALDNLVDLIICCCSHPNAPGQVFMVSDDKDVSFSELCQAIAKGMGKSQLFFPVPVLIISFIASLFGISTMASRILGSLQIDIDHTKATLGWTPVVSMQDAVNGAVEHFLGRKERSHNEENI